MKGVSIIFVVIISAVVLIVLGVILISQPQDLERKEKVIKLEAALTSACIKLKQAHGKCVCAGDYILFGCRGGLKAGISRDFLRSMARIEPGEVSDEARACLNVPDNEFDNCLCTLPEYKGSCECRDGGNSLVVAGVTYESTDPVFDGTDCFAKSGQDFENCVCAIDEFKEHCLCKKYNGVCVDWDQIYTSFKADAKSVCLEYFDLVGGNVRCVHLACVLKCGFYGGEDAKRIRKAYDQCNGRA